jgi:Galactose oxidase, central domain
MKRSLLLSFILCVSGLLAACGGGRGNSCGGGCSQLATHFSVTTPRDATVGAPFSFTVTALDASNAVAKSYAGTIHFTSTDRQAVLPANSTLANGTGTFSATFNTSGSQTITATDAATLTITGLSNAIQVSIAPPIGSFTPTAGNMNFPRAGHTATLLQDGTVLIVGGENSTGPLATAEIFNPSSGMFARTNGDMGTARVGHTATLLTNGTVLVTGGNDATGALATAEIFNPATGMFTPTTGNMETARVGHTATLLNDGSGNVLVAGGGSSPAVLFGPVSDGGTASAELFDPKSGQFTPAGNMSASRIYDTATLLLNDEVLVAGGTNTGSALGDLFSPVNNMFTPTATGGTTALHLAAALFGDGNVLLAGGELESSPCGEGGSLISVKSAASFNSSDASFAETGDMSSSRVSHTATLLTGGEVLIAGGATSHTPCNRGFGTSTFHSVASAELFNPASGTFTPIGNMTTARAAHTATLLGNGKVLVVGGVDANRNALVSAELFQ